jgi:hypothetical protein
VHIEAKTTGTNATGLGTSYAAASQRGVVVGGPQSRIQSRTEPQSYIELLKPVPARHKPEIIVFKGEETPEQARRTGKELIEQLNGTGMEG